LSQITRVTDRRTDGQTEISSQYRVCITCSAVKTDINTEKAQLFYKVGKYHDKIS